MILLTGQLDHFAWNTIPSPRFVNAPFPATIQALDAVNQPVTHYTGTVSLASTNGVPVNPPSSSFVNGAWTGTVNIPQTVSNLVLQASDGGGHAGLANPINVVAAPSLGVGRSAGSLLIFWPMSPNGFVLEVSTNLAAGQWETEGAPPLQVGGQFLESIQLGRTNQFYRLRYTLP
jgi:hypothetical protein